MSANQSQGQRRSSLVVMKMWYTKDLKHARNQVNYIAERSRELEREDREVFGPSEDRADYKAFRDRLDDRATRHPNAVKAHHLIISMRREDFDRYGADYKTVVREIMAKLEQEKGMKLDWVAATHPKEKYPHVHVIIKSVGKTPEGRNKRLSLRRDDFRNIRRNIYQVLRDERAVKRSIERSILEERRRLRQQTRSIMDVGQSIANQMRRLMREEEFRRQLEQRNRDMDRGGRIL